MISDEPRRESTGTVVPLRRPREPMSDEALAGACASGDPAAIAALFHRHGRTVSRFVYQMVHSDDDVEDIVQATFVEVLRGHASFDGRSLVSTWLLGIAANVVRHYVRSKIRRRRFETCLALYAAERRESALSERVHARRTLVLADKVLSQLDIDKQLAFALCELEGLSARDAAAALGATEAAIWKRVSEVRKALRQALSEEAP